MYRFHSLSVFIRKKKIRKNFSVLRKISWRFLFLVEFQPNTVSAQAYISLYTLNLSRENLVLPEQCSF